MDTIRDAAAKPAACIEQTEADMQAASRTIKLDAFQKKYDSMLNLVDFMAGLYLTETKSPGMDGKLQELKSLVAQARKNMRLRQGKNAQPNEFAVSDMGGKHGS